MRTTALAISLLLGLAAAGRAGDRETALAVVEEAIRAAGGPEALAKAQMLSRTGSGVMVLSGSNLPFTEETVLALPDRFRMVVHLDKRYLIAVVINGDKGWQVTGGAALELSKERVEEMREEAYALYLASLLPLRNTALTLAPLPDGLVDDLPVEGVRVSSKGHFDAKLWFDKRTHLLVKLERRAREAGLMLDKTYLFSDYKDVDGVKLPVKQIELLNGKKITERNSASYKLLKRVDEATFGKP